MPPTSKPLVRMLAMALMFVRMGVAGGDPVLPPDEGASRTKLPEANSCGLTQASGTLSNVAKGKPYTVAPAPNYPATTDASDGLQLTDGTTSSGVMWTQKSAVGWRGARPVAITVDLGEPYSIAQVRWRTGAGVADVEWPAAIYVFVSTDGVTYRAIGDLVVADTSTERSGARGYREHTLRGDFQPTAGRYVRLMADRNGSYVFVDEIEVLSFGRVAHLCAEPAHATTPIVTDTVAAFWNARAQRRAGLAIRQDAQRISDRIISMNPNGPDRRLVDEQLRTATAAASQATRTSLITASRLPLSEAHQRMYEVVAYAERLAGRRTMEAWPANPWDPLNPLDERPSKADSALSIKLMPGERRALAFNVRSPLERSLPASIRLELPAEVAATIDLYRINWTGDENSNWVAAELEFLGDGSAARTTTFLPGVTQQIWIQIQPALSGSGPVHGAVAISSARGTIRIPVTIDRFRTRFPQQLSLHFGGWDYTDGSSGYAVTPNNRDQLVRYLTTRHVDTPWATRRVMHWNFLNAAGDISGTQPDTTALRTWLALWPNARRYRVFLSAPENIAGIAMSDRRFEHAVATWANFWASQIRLLNRSPEQFDLLVVDEPKTPEQASITATWARAIHQVEAGFRIWIDPAWANPYDMPANLLTTVDTVSVNLGVADQTGEGYWEWVRKIKAEGKGLEVYLANGPARLMDPYAYYRLAAWRAHARGADALTFWSFSDTRGSASDNEFAGHDYNFSPLFISDATVRPGKQMEAALEGLQDIEYLRLLSSITTQPAWTDESRSVANQLLQQAASIGLRQGSSDTSWRAERDRREADLLRARIGTLLDTLVP